MMDLLLPIITSPFAPWGLCFITILWVGHRANYKIHRMMFHRRELERRIDTLSSEVATLNQQARIMADAVSGYHEIGRGLSELERTIPWQELQVAVRTYVQAERARIGAEAVERDRSEGSPPSGRFGNLVDG